MASGGQVRRVVLGTGTDGRSRVTSDGEVPTVHGAMGVTEVWQSDELPPPYAGDDPTVGHTAPDIAPGLGATRFWIVDFAPQGDVPPYMHRTDSVDYVVVLSGSVTLELEDGEVELHPGDVVVQRGNLHAWRNDSGKVCRVAVVMLGSGQP